MYAPIQRLIHGVMAFLIFIMLPLGLWLPHLDEGPRAAFLYEAHKSIGLLLIVLIGIRLVMRFIYNVPQPPEAVHPSLYHLAKIAHVGLYGLMVFVPLAGLTATASCCAPVEFLGLVPLPLTLSTSEDTTKFLFKLHEYAAWILGVGIAGHVLMALWHRARKDGVFQRMWPD
jgi:cytochrome b561